MRRFLVLIGCMLSMFLYAENIDYMPMPFSNAPITYHYLPFTSTSKMKSYNDYYVPALQSDGTVTYPYEESNTTPTITLPKKSLNFGDDEDPRGIGELMPLEVDEYVLIFLTTLGVLFIIYTRFIKKKQ